MLRRKAQAKIKAAAVRPAARSCRPAAIAAPQRMSTTPVAAANATRPGHRAGKAGARPATKSPQSKACAPKAIRLTPKKTRPSRALGSSLSLGDRGSRDLTRSGTGEDRGPRRVGPWVGFVKLDCTRFEYDFSPNAGAPARRDPAVIQH